MERQELNDILKAGIRAPSGDNVQPWKLQILSDDSFILNVRVNEDANDPFDANNSSWIFACGTFLENIRVYARSKGYEPVMIFDGDLESERIAQVSFVKKTSSETSVRLAKRIFTRACSRLPYARKDLPKQFYADVKSAMTESKGIQARFLDHDPRIVSAIYRTEVLRFALKSAHKVLYQNIRWTKSQIESADGLDYRTLGIPFCPRLPLAIFSVWPLEVLFEWTKVNRIAAIVTCGTPLKNSAGICAITVPDYSKRSIVEAGMALERLWLLLTDYGAHLQPFAALPLFIEDAEVHKAGGFSPDQLERLQTIKSDFFTAANIVEGERLIMIFRYGYSKPPRHMTLRKELSEFIQE